MSHHDMGLASEAGGTIELCAWPDNPCTVLRVGASPDCSALFVGLIALAGLAVPDNSNTWESLSISGPQTP